MRHKHRGASQDSQCEQNVVHWAGGWTGLGCAGLRWARLCWAVHGVELQRTDWAWGGHWPPGLLSLGEQGGHLPFEPLAGERERKGEWCHMSSGGKRAMRCELVGCSSNGRAVHWALGAGSPGPGAGPDKRPLFERVASGATSVSAYGLRPLRGE